MALNIWTAGALPASVAFDRLRLTLAPRASRFDKLSVTRNATMPARRRRSVAGG
jgi:hypothetical protein